MRKDIFRKRKAGFFLQRFFSTLFLKRRFCLTAVFFCVPGFVLSQDGLWTDFTECVWVYKIALLVSSGALFLGKTRQRRNKNMLGKRNIEKHRRGIWKNRIKTWITFSSTLKIIGLVTKKGMLSKKLSFQTSFQNLLNQGRCWN